MKHRVWAILFLLSLWVATPAWAGPVLVISIDGMRPDCVTQADAHGLKVPNLRRFLVAGSYAEGVIGVVPTVTYPSHTTLMTGVWPADHGIYANRPFDPLRVDPIGWNWYGQDIKVPTLWEAADRAGIVTASVNWPVTIDARGVQYLIPEFWLARTPEDHKIMEAISRPEGWLSGIEAKLGPYYEIGGQAVETDELRTKFALEILSTQKPGFMTLHLASLDHFEHFTGPFSKESNQALEALDDMIGRLIKAALANDRSAVVAIVSDHGFSPTDRHINLMLPFIEDGLVKLKKPASSTDAPKVASWDATLLPGGGMVAVMLRDPEDAALRKRVKILLLKMKNDPQYEIGSVIEQPEIAELGGFPEASFLIDMKLRAEPTWNLTGPLVQMAPDTGEHGYLPSHPELRSSFFIMGGNIYAGRDLGVVDMRQIAPTLAAIMGVNLPSAKMEKLQIVP
jgi:predicted AlkP superfamily pyrophosphatase or phosphodiesterase